MNSNCYTNDGDYLGFNYYNRYKYRFIDGKILNLKSAYEKPVEKHIAELSEDKVKFKEVFKELALYLSDDHIHYNECCHYMCCRYISYLIHEKIRSLNNTICDVEIFKEFQNFAKILAQAIGTKRCDKKFDFLTEDVINKMQILYKLYDYYNQIKPLDVNIGDNKNKLCSTLSLFVNSFNEINVDLLKDDAFNDKLEALKKLMKLERSWATDRTCSSNLNSIRLKKNDPPPEIVPPNHNQHQVALTPPLTSEVVQGPKADLEAQVTPISGVQSGLGDTLESIDTLGQEEKLESSLSTEFDSVPKPIETLKPSQERELVGTHRHPSFYTYSTLGDKRIDGMDGENLIGNLHTPPRGQEGVLASMRNTLSSIVQNVDPVPVVGVSGGMGALFLLFRYTPVGAFFRGGRGRARRIPSGFSGQFLGGFPGYEDYDVGHIGYGPMSMNPLAE